MYVHRFKASEFGAVHFRVGEVTVLIDRRARERGGRDLFVGIEAPRDVPITMHQGEPPPKAAPLAAAAPQRPVLSLLRRA